MYLLIGKVTEQWTISLMYVMYTVTVVLAIEAILPVFYVPYSTSSAHTFYVISRSAIISCVD